MHLIYLLISLHLSRLLCISILGWVLLLLVFGMIVLHLSLSYRSVLWLFWLLLTIYRSLGHSWRLLSLGVFSYMVLVDSAGLHNYFIEVEFRYCVKYSHRYSQRLVNSLYFRVRTSVVNIWGPWLCLWGWRRFAQAIGVTELAMEVKDLTLKSCLVNLTELLWLWV